MIKRFKINKLFRFRNINITFNDNIKILIRENGLGKTTILNCLYYVLNENHQKTSLTNFEKIELEYVYP